MKNTFPMLAMIAWTGLGAVALAQPAGGPDAKGNAPVKAAHTINDGSAKPGANSFTQGQARQHILNSGYSSVSGLTKGQDGVWRGTAMKNGATANVALDFKGNVSEAPGATSSSVEQRTVSWAPAPVAGASTRDEAAAPAPASMTRHHHHWRHHTWRRHWRHRSRCADPGLNGAACSGVDTNGSGISDRAEHTRS